MRKTDGPVFIGGPHRSGTGMLRAVIGSHSRIAIPPKEYCFFELLGPPGRIPAIRHPQLLREILAWPKIRQWGLAEAEVEAFAAPAGHTLKAIYSAPLLAYASRLGKPGFGEKTPYLERNFDVLLDWFGPSLRFFQMIRDPFHTYLSMTHYREFKHCPSAEQFSNQWRASLLTGLRYSRLYPDNYMLLKYEDFVAHPRHWTEAICEFAGFPPETDRMLAMDDFSRKRNSSFVVEQECAHGCHQVIPPFQSGRPALSATTEQLIQSAVFPDAANIGYVARLSH